MDFEKQLARAEASYLREHEGEEEVASLREIAKELLIYFLREERELIEKQIELAFEFDFEKCKSIAKDIDGVYEEIDELQEYLTSGDPYNSLIDTLEDVQQDIQRGHIKLTDLREWGYEY